MSNNLSPLVSIVMCVYNGEKFLPKQIESVLNQTYTNIELLCLNDVSTDSSAEILISYQQNDDRVKVITNEINLGYNKNFEKGISISSGEFVAICDQDDIWLPHKIEELITGIGDNLLIYSNSTLIDDEDQELGRTLGHKVRHIDNPSYKAFLEGNFITGHTCLFKRELINYILPFPANIKYYDWWIGIAAAYTGSIKYEDKMLTKHRVHQASAIQSDKAKSVSLTMRNIEIAKQMQTFLNAAFVSPADKKFVAHFLTLKTEASNNLVNFIKCYAFLYTKFDEICPWYRKSYFSKLNFIRKSCV